MFEVGIVVQNNRMVQLCDSSELGLRCFVYWPFEPRSFVQIGDKIVYFD